MNFLLAVLLIAYSPEDVVEPKVSITKEYLAPIGMPVVTLYHNIKESQFLNMHHTDATGLEAIGDFFLAPSRYLFDGKDVCLQNGQCEVRPSFSYESHGWTKTIFSLVALPFGEILGSAFKGASLLSHKNYAHFCAITTSLEDRQIVSQETFYHEIGIEQFHCDEVAPCLGYQRPSVLSQTHQLEIQAMKEVCRLLDEHGIIYWLDCGTCLGAYRYGGIIPWDEDIDLSILAPDHDNVKKVLKKLDPSRFQVQDWSSYKYPKTLLKLYLKETKTLVDIYHYNIQPEERTISYFYSYQDSAFPDDWKKYETIMTKPLAYEVVFPLKRANLDGIPVWVPNQIVPFLHSKYGKNLEPTMVWDETAGHYLKVKNHPYWTLFKEEL